MARHRSALALAATGLLLGAAGGARANDEYVNLKVKSGPQDFAVWPTELNWWAHDFLCHSIQFSPAVPGPNISPQSSDPRARTPDLTFFSINQSCWGAYDQSNNRVGYKFTLRTLSLFDLGNWSFVCDSIQANGACVFNGCIPICDPRGTVFRNAEPLTIHVHVFDEPPNIHGVPHGPDPVAWNSRVTLGADVDRGDAPLSFHWTTVQKPPASAAALSNTLDAAPVLQLGSIRPRCGCASPLSRARQAFPSLATRSS
jgi:hypothetical protein